MTLPEFKELLADYRIAVQSTAMCLEYDCNDEFSQEQIAQAQSYEEQVKQKLLDTFGSQRIP